MRSKAVELSDEALALCVERAIAWAMERVGSADYALRCLSFVEDAYERPNDIEVFGGDSATESADRYAVRSSTGPAPAGAFVFFDCSGPIEGVVRDWGHVGLALGDGRMVHAWGRVGVDVIGSTLDLPASNGWSAPVYVGWAAPRRIVDGARQRSWGRSSHGAEGRR
jgi:cell wall-associated NlpC family hydrolase